MHFPLLRYSFSEYIIGNLEWTAETSEFFLKHWFEKMLSNKNPLQQPWFLIRISFTSVYFLFGTLGESWLLSIFYNS